VLIPRPETEQLVDWIIQDVKLQKIDKPIRILDIGTGSGCIAISLAKNLNNAEIWALDVSIDALEIAKKNALLNEVAIHFVEGDILNLKNFNFKFDIIVSNPPYVREKEKVEIHRNVLDYDPRVALFVKDDNPLLFYDAIADLTKNSLKKEGCLYLEINQYLGKESVDLLIKKGYKSIELKKDFLDNNRMIKARL
jgi:release factor glutamine methyltransferase